MSDYLVGSFKLRVAAPLKGVLGPPSPTPTISPGLLHHSQQFPCTHTPVCSLLCINSPLIILIWLSHLFPAEIPMYTITLYSD